MIPKVSIIVPVFNVDRYLRKCLDSLINQTMREIEIICFNDASTDNSIAILKEYASKDKRIQVIDSEINIKQGGGRNAGIRASKAPYVMFVDSDDWVDYNYVELLYNQAVTSNADIVICDCYIVCEDKKERRISAGVVCTNDSDHIKSGIFSSGCSLCTGIFRKSLFIDNRLFFPENMYYEDNAIASVLFAKARRLSKIDQSLYNYRQNQSSTTHRRNDIRYFDRLKAAIMLVENFKQQGLYERYEKEIKHVFFKQYYRNSIPGIIKNFSHIPYKKITEIQKTVTQFITRKDLQHYINQESIADRIIFRTISISPRFAVFIFKLRELISRFINK